MKYYDHCWSWRADTSNPRSVSSQSWQLALALWSACIFWVSPPYGYSVDWIHSNMSGGVFARELSIVQQEMADGMHLETIP